MAKRKPTPQEDARFEEFLKKQFAELRRELEKYAQGGLQKKEGKVLQLSQAPQSHAGKGTQSALNRPWQRRLRHIYGPIKYGIAAVVLAAVAVPMIIQLNRQKAEMANQAQAPSIEPDSKALSQKNNEQAPEEKKTRVDTKSASRDPEAVSDKTDGYFKKRTKTHKKIADKEADIDSAGDVLAGERAAGNAKKSREEDSVSRDRYAAAEAAPGAAGSADAGKDLRMAKEDVKPTLRATAPKYDAGGDADDSRQSAATASPAAPAPSAAPAKPASRSIAVDDAQSRLKKQQASDDEKAEMEKLWKEFEKDPESFSRDRKRSARLKTLLSRHESKSKNRAKRVQAAETQYAQ